MKLPGTDFLRDIVVVGMRLLMRGGECRCEGDRVVLKFDLLVIDFDT